MAFLHGFILRGVSGVTFLPKEFSRAQEQACAHLPTHDVGPLVHQQGQVAVALDPVLVGVPNDGLGRRTNNQLFLQTGVRIHDHPFSVGVVLQAVVGHHRALLGKALHVGGLLAEVALGNEEREVRVHVAGVLEHAVKHVLHALPNGKPVRLDDHASLHIAVLGEVRLHDEFVVPLAVIIVAGRQFAGHFWYGLCCSV